VNVPLLDLVAQYQTIKDEVLASLMRVVERQGFIMGPEVAELETALASLCHARHGIACASGTDALLLPLKALDLRPGDEVICPAFTFFATAGAVHNAGGTPVFADIDAATFNLDPDALAAAVTPRTRAVVVVHLYGQMAAMERILPIAERHGLAVIEDGAQSIGARRDVGLAGAPDWRVAGELGRVGTLSFFPSKNLGAWGDGGMMVTQDDAIATRLKRLRVHGGAKQYFHDEVGYNSRLDALQAAVLGAKMKYLAEWSEARRQHARYYDAAFADVGEIRTPTIDPANESIYNQYTLRVERRDELQAFLKKNEIGSAVYYPLPLHLQPCFEYLGYQKGSCPESERAAAEVLSLPVYPEMTRAMQDEVIDAVRRFYGH
jgi:dTDP-4-amino-4,6-dideoxygalactose transaminase